MYLFETLSFCESEFIRVLSSFRDCSLGRLKIVFMKSVPLGDVHMEYSLCLRFSTKLERQ